MIIEILVGPADDLSQAIQKAPAGAVLKLQGAAYDLAGPLRVDKPITLIGTGDLPNPTSLASLFLSLHRPTMNDPEIARSIWEWHARGKHAGTATAPKSIVMTLVRSQYAIEFVDDTYLSNLCFVQAGSARCDCVVVRGSPGLTATRCFFLGSSAPPDGCGLRISHSKKVALEYCVAGWNAGHGILLMDSDVRMIRDTLCYRNEGDGLHCDGNSRTTCLHCAFLSNKHDGVHASGRSHLSAHNCLFTKNGVQGIAFYDEGSGAVIGTHCTENGAKGVYVDGTGTVAVEKCRLARNNESGFASYLSSRGHIHACYLIDNKGYGAFLGDTSGFRMSALTCEGNASGPYCQVSKNSSWASPPKLVSAGPKPSFAFRPPPKGQSAGQKAPQPVAPVPVRAVPPQSLPQPAVVREVAPKALERPEPAVLSAKASHVAPALQSEPVVPPIVSARPTEPSATSATRTEERAPKQGLDVRQLANEDARSRDGFIKSARAEIVRLRPSLQSPANWSPVQAELDRRRGETSREMTQIVSVGFSLRVTAKTRSQHERTFYLTKANVGLADHDPPLVSWQSPIARLRLAEFGETMTAGSMDYEVVLKGTYGSSTPRLLNVQYETESCREIVPDLEMHCGKEEAPAAARTTIRKSLGLDEIIFLTDRLQDDTMRFPMQNHLLIEGAAGSGKTTIALQRMAYLVYQQEEELDLPPGRRFFDAESMTIFVSNEVMGEYLGSLLGTLSLSAVEVRQLRTFVHDYVIERHSKVKGQIRSEYGKEAGLLSCRRSILGHLRDAVVAFMAEDLPAWRDEVVRLLDTRFGAAPARVAAERSDAEAVLRHVERAVDAGSPSLSPAVGEIIELRTNKNPVAREMGDLLSRFAPPPALLRRFVLSNRAADYVREAMEDDTDGLAPKLEAALSAWRGATTAGNLDQNDLALIAWITHWRTGKCDSGPDMRISWARGSEVFSHVVVDEAQDFSEVELSFALELADPKYRSATVVGDLKQRITWPTGIANWQRAGVRVFSNEGKRGIFMINYRQTSALGALAMSFYRAAFGEEPDFKASNRRAGAKPRLVLAGTLEQRIRATAEYLKAVLEREAGIGGRSFCVIVSDPDLADEVADGIDEQIDVIRCKASRGAQLKERGVVHVASTSDIKGLEFDAVVAFDIDHCEAQAETIGRQLQYVSLTRARDDLLIVVEQLTPIWSQLVRESVVEHLS